MPDITATELKDRIMQGTLPHLIDVRNKFEYHTYNIGGINIPLGQLHPAIENLQWNKSDEIIVICQVGLRSKTAKQLLEQSGYQSVKSLTGGLISFQKLQSTY